MSSAKKFFTEIQKKQIENAILKAELETSGEIRVHVANECKGDVLDCAAAMFAKLKMHKTDLRNGVLLYISVNDHQFAIIGDAGINAVVPSDFWNQVKEHLLQNFKQGKFTEGLCEGIQMAGENLRIHFPFEKGDKNELSNTINF